MDTFETAGNSPEGLSGNRYYKTSEYQIVKVLRKVFFLLEMGVGAIVRLCVDVIKGLVGKS